MQTRRTFVPQRSLRSRCHKPLGHVHLSPRAKLALVRSLKYPQEEAPVMPSAPPRAYPRSSRGSLVCPSAHGPQHGVPTVGSFRQSPSNASPPALPVVSPHGRTHATRHSHCQSLPPAGPRERASPAAIQVGQGSPPRPCDATCGRARAAADGRRTVRKPPMLSQLTLLHGPRLHHGLVVHLHASHSLDEANGAERLGKRIGRLCARLDIRHLDHALLHALAHEVVTDVNVLCPGASCESSPTPTGCRSG